MGQIAIKAYTEAVTRWAQLTDERSRDRGEGPVSNAVVIAVAAAGAVLLGTIITAAVNTWGAKIPK
ncbi:hypothetical protein [Actinoplanes regularis]|uniref:hypothetical protein n=1 Tax=Actinoplanes regularis TaxID=52697 RepID=UPI0024A3DDB8|nr:hypothetical protein [Actinoplanes regularis]GLW34481.1 hypothetical protein Areg01_74180 [Actinoplanes regularis]